MQKFSYITQNKKIFFFRIVDKKTILLNLKIKPIQKHQSS
jgi:hypothetical protein